MCDLSVDEAYAIQTRQLNHYKAQLPADKQAGFVEAVDKAQSAKFVRSHREVVRGGEIERLYYLAMGKTEEDHRKFCASLD